jgi:hypothetical protein
MAFKLPASTLFHYLPLSPGFVDCALPQCFRHPLVTLWMLLQIFGTKRPTLAYQSLAQPRLSQAMVPLFVSRKTSVLSCAILSTTTRHTVSERRGYQ